MCLQLLLVTSALREVAGIGLRLQCSVATAASLQALSLPAAS